MAGQLTSETLATGLSITNTYDSLLRRSSLSALHTSSFLLHTFGYDSASRLATVSDGTNTATYTYVANSPLVSQIAFTQSGQPRMTTTKQYDALNRLTSIASAAPNSSSAISFAYEYNSANQRTRTTHADASYWIYQYDTLGQVTSGKRFWPDGTPVAGQQFEYGFDDIGNRQSAAHGGNAGGSNLRVETYTANDLNQYTQRTVPGFAEVQGRARSDATVTVNLQSTLRQGPYWRAELNADNSASPVWLGVTNVAVLRGAGAGGTDLVASNTGTLFLPQTPETFTHDADGNLTRDGRWTNSWDAENRLIRTESLAPETIRTSTFDIRNSKVRQDWSFLPDGRWSQRVIYSWTDNDWLPQVTNRFLWDGQVLLAVLNGANQPEQTYLRGSDLSGTMQGAGGVGGLLAINLGTNGTHFACFDGNGNVSALLNANSSSLTALYEYDPFGNTLRATGPAAEANSLRFSTQFTDDVTLRVKYLYRDYDAGVGRWPNRDPLGEEGGVNLYGFVANTPVNAIDPFGLVILGFYGADISYRWPNAGNQKLEEISTTLEQYDTVLRPRRIHGMPPTWPKRLYQSRDDATAFNDLLNYLDTNKDGFYNPPCDDKEPIKIFGWSWGGASAVELANRIKNSPKFKDKEIQVVVTIDPVTIIRPSSHTVPDNVQFFANFIQTKGDTSYGGPFHGSFLTSNARRSWQWDANHDGKQTVFAPESNQVLSVNHTFIIWKVQSDVIDALK